MPVNQNVENSGRPLPNLSGQSGHCFRLGAQRLLQSLRSPAIRLRQMARARGSALSCAPRRLTQSRVLGAYRSLRPNFSMRPHTHTVSSVNGAAGLLIVLVLLASLDLVIAEFTVRNSRVLAQGTIFEPVPVSGTQFEAVAAIA